MSLKRSKSRDRGAIPFISNPTPIPTSPPILDKEKENISTKLQKGITASPSLKKKRSNSILKRSASWSSEARKKERMAVVAAASTKKAVGVGSVDVVGSLGTGARPTPIVSDNPLAVDVARFADDNFNEEEYMKRSLADTNEEGVRIFHKSLQEARQFVGADLQKNVYRNYNEFVIISKEISNLETDMLTLRNFLNDLRSINDAFKDDGDTLGIISGASQIADSVIPRRKPNEGINTDMHSLYKAQMQVLWEGVEGSQKFVPFLPNRHIVKESGNFVELNSNNKPKQGIHLFLLNDCLLVATRKKRAMSTKLKLVAERCWPLNEIAVIDIKDSPDVTNAFKVMKHPESFIYRAEKPEEKAGFLVMIKRNTDEMMEVKRRERDALRAKTESVMIIAGSDTADLRNNLSKSSRKPLPPPPPVPSSRNRDMEEEDFPEKGMNASDMRWMANLPDELEVCIAQREFESAVAYVEKARAILTAHGGDSTKLEAIRREIDRYVSRLCTSISRDLSHPLLTKVQFQRNVTWLLRLGLGEEAREVFLAARAGVIKQRTRQLTFEGDITTYISEFALIVFTLIRNTCDWYRDSFKDNRMASGFVKWAREQVEIYATVYRKQVFNHNQQNFQIIADCLRSTADQCLTLRKVGLDLNFLLEELFENDIRETITAYETRCLDRLAKVVENDNFAVVSSQNLGTEVKVTASVVSFYNILIQFVTDVCLLAKIALYIKVIDGVSNLTEQYLTRMMTESRQRDLSKDQRYAAAMNVSFVLDNIVPRISSQLNRHFDRPIPELDTLRARLRELGFA